VDPNASKAVAIPAKPFQFIICDSFPSKEEFYPKKAAWRSCAFGITNHVPLAIFRTMMAFREQNDNAIINRPDGTHQIPLKC
jgi:hypothetical protein